MIHRFAMVRRSAAILGQSPAAYAIALLAFLSAFGVRYLIAVAYDYGFHDWFAPAPFFTIYPTILVTTFFLGLGPGILVAALGGLSAWYFFLEPVYTFELHAANAVALGLYACSAAIDIALVRLLALSLDWLEAEKSKSEAYAGEREILFTELQHRISNHLQLVSMLLEAQRDRVRDEHARQAMADASRRLAMVGNLHRKLHDPGYGQIEVGAFLKELSGDVLATWGRPTVTCRVDAMPLVLPADKSTSVALIVTELMSNALEHGLAGRLEGRISIALTVRDASEVELTVADDGDGLPAGFDPNAVKSLGLRVVRTLARQLGGSFEIRCDRGTICRLTFPIPSGAHGGAVSDAAALRLSAA